MVSSDMGTFRLDIELENPATRGQRAHVAAVLVDTGAELSCVPSGVLETLGIERQKKLRFRQADGSTFERWAGYAIVHAAGTFTVDEVVFGDPRDLVLLGARTLEGLNLRIDPVLRALVDAGPMPMAGVT